MGTKSRETIYGASIRAAADRATKARKEADRLAVEVGGPSAWATPQPQPSQRVFGTVYSRTMSFDPIVETSSL
jgi:hypothetical protein